jgi:methyl-accepting chemotaxis protein
MSLSEGNAPAISTSLEQLSKTAISLNKASDRLNQAINQLNESLKKLNLGISSWVRFYVYEEGPLSDLHEIGYGKVNGNWGIAIRRIFEDLNKPSEYQTEITEWQFSEAPRDMRIDAIPYLTKVIDRLNKDAEKTAQLISDKSNDAEELAKAIDALLDPPRRSLATRHQGGR